VTTVHDQTAQVSLERHADAAVLTLAGAWQLGRTSADVAHVLPGLRTLPHGAVVRIDTARLGVWDSSLVAFLLQAVDVGRAQGCDVDLAALPDGLRKLLDLALAVPEKRDARRAEVTRPFVERVGRSTLDLGDEFGGFVGFLGEVTAAVGRFVTGRARFNRSDLGLVVQQVGVDALGVVALINFLVGLILAFVGAAQLRQFGAAIFVADLVGIAMIRDMAAIMTAIVIAGRSGAAFAASLGTMQSNQEIDALRTTGISPIDYLVLPRVVALILMMPLLTLFADVLGVLGGAVVGIFMLDLSPTLYLEQTTSAVGMDHLLGGIFKGTVYGALVAIAGCWRGMLSGRTAAAVGLATTSAVVTSILLIISAAGLFTVLFYVLGI
jgi:phospholipid/cholesterol/gamma-HCH transport system permease protein